MRGQQLNFTKPSGTLPMKPDAKNFFAIKAAPIYTNNMPAIQLANNRNIQYRGQAVAIPVGISSQNLQMISNSRLLVALLVICNVAAVGCSVSLTVNNEKIIDGVDIIELNAATGAAIFTNQNMNPDGYNLLRPISGNDKVTIDFNNLSGAAIVSNFRCSYTNFVSSGT